MNLYDPSIETASERKIKELQLKALRWELSVAQRSPLYRKKFREIENPPKISSLEDLSSLPFTTKSDLRESYPFGAVATKREDLVFFCNSSGTTGKPVAVYLTRRDIKRSEIFQARGLYSTGIRKQDCAQLMIAPVMALLFERALHRIGAMSVLTGPGNASGQISLMRDLGTTTLFGVPTYLIHLGEKMEGEVSVPRIVTLGEPLTESVRRKIENLWGADVYDDYGSIELAAGFLECEEHAGHHVFWDNFLIETINPETGESTDEEGELVFTTLYREAMPLIRYRTGDLVRIEWDRCACGRTHPRIFIEGRLGEMVKIKGTAVYPSTIREKITGLPGVSNFQVIVDRTGGLDRLRVKIEAIDAGKDLEDRIIECVKGATNVTPQVEFVPSGSLLGERKTRQFIDLR